MKVQISREELLKKLDLVGKVSTKHVTLPVLQCVLLSTEKGKLFLRATNLEIGIEASLEAKIETEGSIAVPANVLLQTINLSNQKEVSLKTTESGLVVESRGSDTLIKNIPHEEFPSIPKIEGSGQVVNNKTFSLGIKTAAFAASVSSIKPELGSVYIFQKKEHSLTFVATDSFRLMEKTVNQKGVIFDSSVLIPQKNAIEIARVLDVNDEDPVCRFNENQFSLEFGSGVYVTSRLVSGSFPDYEQIMPKEFMVSAIVLKDDLLHSFKKTSIFLDKFSKVNLSVSNNNLIVSTFGGEAGNTTESIKSETSGEDINLNFNQRYLNEVLNHFVDDSIKLQFSGIGRPVIINGLSDNSIRYLVMPMNK